MARRGRKSFLSPKRVSPLRRRPETRAMEIVPRVLAYLVTFGLGGAVGLAELVSRYRDAPDDAIKEPPALWYIAINASASLLALRLIRVFRWQFGMTKGDQAVL